jgi:ATP-dependent DNA helicase RecQ
MPWRKNSTLNLRLIAFEFFAQLANKGHKMTAPTIHHILKKYWGYDTFRPLQEEIITSVLEGKDTLALLPTGGGKSICFQVPALVKDGLCLVISPLIALMKDQVMNLKKKGIKAEALHTGLRHDEADAIFSTCIFGGVKFLYVSPERLASEDFRSRLKQMKINLLAIDEAHCISQWGYDFRPPYLRIAEVRETLENIPVLALTATATLKVADDITTQLNFRTKNIFSKSFQRKNLSYVVRQTTDKQNQLLNVLNKVPGTSVVYVRTRKGTKDAAQFLKANKINADFYHAGLSTDERSQKQEAWVNNKTRVMVCTNAFGMGIDKPDVRTVIHLDVPESLEAYFQEAGRAGRDEKKAYAVLLTDSDDKKNILESINNFPSVADLQNTYEQLCNYCELALNFDSKLSHSFDIGRFVIYAKMNTAKTLKCISMLAQLEIVSLTDAVFQRPQIKCITSKEGLFHFQNNNKTFEPLVKMILRTCEGVFEDFVPINQNEIAFRLNISINDLIVQLHQLKKAEVFQYIPLKEQPQLTFAHERVEARHLHFQPEKIEFRRKQNEERLKAMLHYFTVHHICRSSILVNYFGEHYAEKCGVCDVCIAERKSGLDAKLFADIVAQLQKVLQEPQPIEKIIAAINFSQEKTIATLQHLTEAEIVRKNTGGAFVWNG